MRHTFTPGRLVADWTTAEGLRACVTKLEDRADHLAWLKVPPGHPLFGYGPFKQFEFRGRSRQLRHILSPWDGGVIRVLRDGVNGPWAFVLAHDEDCRWSFNRAFDVARMASEKVAELVSGQGEPQ